jgi:hypothetical protein
MAAGITSGVCFSGGSPKSFLLGALFYGLSNVLDCCDGMIARLKKNGTPTGRIVDGLVDYINGIAVYTGVAIGLTKAVQSGALHLPFNAWVLMIAAAASFAAHAMFSDKYRNAYLEQVRQPSGNEQTELEKCKTEQTRLHGLKGHGFDKMLINLYCKYLALQRPLPKVGEHRQTVKMVSGTTVILWNCIGPSTHISFLIVSACLFRPSVFFLYVIAAANVWMIFLLALQMNSAPARR